MDVEEDFHSQIYTNKYHRNNDADDDDTPTPNNTASTAVLTQVQQPDNDNHHQLFRGWHNSSRIFRVSRASGGKDRHSKVLTSKGLRDRRVRLSVSTAIEFYDLQDRLGYDQPSKAVEWLIKAAAESIAELPSLHGPFPDAKLGFHHESSAADADSQIQQHTNLSACSTSETSKGSGLSLTRTDVRVNQRVKARERARVRAKEKECESEHQVVNDGQRRRCTNTQASSVANPISSSTTFTELLTGGNQSGSSTPNNSTPTPMMNYFSTNAGLFLGQTQMGISMNTMPPAAFHLTTGEHHHQHDVHHFSFGQQNGDHHYDLNFTISPSSPSGLAAGFNNRGTLQSNSPASSLLHHHNLRQRYTNNNNAAAAAAVSMEGSAVPAFFMTTTAAPSSMDNHHFSTGLDGGLHLYYGDHKDKGKN